jgi:flagellin-like hook-associated protein FlgL
LAIAGIDAPLNSIQWLGFKLVQSKQWTESDTGVAMFQEELSRLEVEIKSLGGSNFPGNRHIAPVRLHA